MNERQAELEGLHFTGIYNFDKEATKTRIAEERKKYPGARIVMVYEPGSKLSRGGARGGYSAYADDMYSALKLIRECEGMHDRHKIALRALKEEYNNKVEQCEAGYKSRIEKLNEAEKFVLTHITTP